MSGTPEHSTTTAEERAKTASRGEIAPPAAWTATKTSTSTGTGNSRENPHNRSGRQRGNSSEPKREESRERSSERKNDTGRGYHGRREGEGGQWTIASGERYKREQHRDNRSRDNHGSRGRNEQHGRSNRHNAKNNNNRAHEKNNNNRTHDDRGGRHQNYKGPKFDKLDWRYNETWPLTNMSRIDWDDAYRILGPTYYDAMEPGAHELQSGFYNKWLVQNYVGGPCKFWSNGDVYPSWFKCTGPHNKVDVEAVTALAEQITEALDVFPMPALVPVTQGQGIETSGSTAPDSNKERPR
jgi:hypothetical protein